MKIYLPLIFSHGVPSPRVWREYIKYQKKAFSSKACSATFRDKSNGWLSYCYRINFSDNREYSNVNYKDIYSKLFIQNITLRESCYDCKFKTVNKNSDITIGDLWGIKDILPNAADDKGGSVAFVQSEKAKYLLEQVKDYLWYQEIHFDLAIANNSAMKKSVFEHNFRDYFFKNLEKNLESLVEDCLNTSYYV